MRILIVDDDLASINLMKKYLEPVGECETASDGKEAIKAFRKSFREHLPFDLICLDIMMPRLNGHETLLKLREIEKKEGVQVGEGTKILMASAKSDNDTILKAFMQLCDGYISKPLTKRGLYEKLHEIELISAGATP